MTSPSFLNYPYKLAAKNFVSFPRQALKIFLTPLVLLPVNKAITA